MNLKTFHKLIDRWTKESKVTSTGKGKDYAKESDTLLNFKNLSKLCKILDIDVRRAPSEVALFFRIHKMQRLGNTKGRKPNNESRKDSHKDDLTYHFLHLGCEEDETKRRRKPKRRRKK